MSVLTCQLHVLYLFLGRHSTHSSKESQWSVMNKWWKRKSSSLDIWRSKNRVVQHFLIELDSRLFPCPSSSFAFDRWVDAMVVCNLIGLSLKLKWRIQCIPIKQEERSNLPMALESYLQSKCGECQKKWKQKADMIMNLKCYLFSLSQNLLTHKIVVKTLAAQHPRGILLRNCLSWVIHCEWKIEGGTKKKRGIVVVAVDRSQHSRLFYVFFYPNMNLSFRKVAWEMKYQMSR